MDGEGKVQKDFAGPAGQMNGKVLGGISNHTSPFMEGWFGKNYDSGGVLFHANYASSNGQVADANWQKTGIGIQGGYLSPQTFGMFAGSRLNGGLNFSGQTYRAYRLLGAVAAKDAERCEPQSGTCFPGHRQ